ncbi:MAG: hypothetical protein ACRBBN_03605 [Methyloligellaceae bacterium]
MGAVLKFRRDSKSVSRLFKKKKRKYVGEGEELGQIIIFPGIRIERHCDDYLTDEEDDHDSDTKNAG